MAPELLLLGPWGLLGGEGGTPMEDSRRISAHVSEALPLSFTPVRGLLLQVLETGCGTNKYLPYPLHSHSLHSALASNKTALPSLFISNNNPNNTLHIRKSFHLRK